MKLSLLLTSIALCFALIAFPILNLQAQTQEEIEQMLNGGSSDAPKKDTKEKKVKETKEKKEKGNEKAIEDEENAVEQAKSTEKEVKEKTEKEKKEKEAKGKSVKEKSPAVEEIPSDSPKEKIVEEKIKEEPKTSAPKLSSGSGRGSSYTKPLRSWTIGLGGNLTNPYTDIRYKDFFGTLDPKNENQWGAQMRVTKMFDGAFGVMFQAQYNRLQGTFDSLVVNDEDRDYLVGAGLNRGVFFRNNVIQGSLNLYWNISNTVFGVNRQYQAQNSGKPIKPRRFSLYTYAGLGISVFDPHVMFNQDNAPASFNGVKFYDDQSAEVVIPWAIGTKFNLGKTLNLSLEYGFNYIFTDKLDGFIFDHPGRVKNDLYSNVSMIFEFKAGNKKKAKEHIEWTNPIEPLYEDIANLNKRVKRLTTDADEDGVSDYFDKDTDTEEGVVVDGAGQALDIDGDGIPDHADLEPLSDAGAETDEFGRSLDDDNDGVPNHKDLSPETEEGTFVNFQGMSVEDNIKMPKGSGTGDGFGMPSVYFDTDKSTVKREWEDELFLIARTLKRNPGLVVTAVGHCDERASDEYNMALGQDRADNVKAYLVENYKIEAERINTVSKGKSEMDNKIYHINRRVDIEIVE